MGSIVTIVNNVHGLRAKQQTILEISLDRLFPCRAREIQSIVHVLDMYFFFIHCLLNSREKMTLLTL